MVTRSNEPLAPAEALQFWKSKVPLTKKEFEALAQEARIYAFKVAGVARLEQLKAMQKAMYKAIQNGERARDFAARIRDIVQEQGWTGKGAWRVNNIFRTNLQTSYAVGRYKHAKAIAEYFPYWKYGAVNDDRTRTDHRALHDLVFKHDHPFWDMYYPPNGYQCRCNVTPLTATMVKKYGLEVTEEWDGVVEPIDPETGQPLPLVRPVPDKGFEFNPGKAAWKPDWSKYPPDFAQSIQVAIAKATGNKKVVEELAKGAVVGLGIATQEDMVRVLEEKLADILPKNKPPVIKITKAKTYWMATHTDGRILVAGASKSDFVPSRELFSALKKLGKENLTFYEEYALEALWHEVLHNFQPWNKKYKMSKKQEAVAEVINQWLARLSYPEFLGLLVPGVKPSHKKQILTEGLGYNSAVKNFNLLLAKLGLKASDVVDDFMLIHRKEHPSTYLTSLPSLLAKKSGISARLIRKILGGIDDVKDIHWTRFNYLSPLSHL